jgi:hypothetical protein
VIRVRYGTSITKPSSHAHAERTRSPSLLDGRGSDRKQAGLTSPASAVVTEVLGVLSGSTAEKIPLLRCRAQDHRP